jgi:uncharacterized protein (DUF362 family)
MDRRSFIKRTAATGAAAFVSTSVIGNKVFAGLSAKEADISVVNGSDYFANTIKAVDMLGGMQNFVPAGATVGLIINSGFEESGAYVHPDISISTIKMCFDAGAENVKLLQVVASDYWKKSAHYEDYAELLDGVSKVESNNFPAEFNDDDWVLIPEIEGAVSLKDVEVIKALMEVDVLINVFIAKHHAGTLYTGALKNSMGFCTRQTNVFYHLGSGERNNPDFLAQCIADINLLRQPDLIIGDATEFIVSNGPSGPGEILKLDKIFAGTNLVAMDSLGVTYNDMVAEDIPSLIKAENNGLGKYDISELNIVEAT